MSRRVTWAGALLVALIAGPSAAHDGHSHKIMGTVTDRQEKVVHVKTPSGEVLSIAVNEKTAITRGKAKVDLAEVKSGRRVVVDIGNGEDPLTAHEIQLGATQLSKKEP